MECAQSRPLAIGEMGHAGRVLLHPPVTFRMPRRWPRRCWVMRSRRCGEPTRRRYGSWRSTPLSYGDRIDVQHLISVGVGRRCDVRWALTGQSSTADPGDSSIGQRGGWPARRSKLQK